MTPRPLPLASRTQVRVGCLLFMLLTPLATPAADGVVLLHGLCRTSRSMTRLEAAFTIAGYTVVNVDYPSRTAPIATLGREAIGGALAHPRLQSATRIHFVTHSLGGILVRSYFAEQPDPRLGRVVMLGPPNQGSEVVDRLGSWWIFGRLNGPAGRQLGTGPASVPNTLGPVDFELGIIAGNRTINWINSLMIPGANDGKVSVTRTRVDGMKEHLVLPVSHPFLMRHPRVIEAALRFVREGRFQAGSGGA